MGFLTIALGYPMAAAKHLIEAEMHGPSNQTVDPRASMQPILDAVR
jgi:hypothetical protein